MSRRRQQTAPEHGAAQDFPGVERRACDDSSTRNRRGPTQRPMSGEGGSHKPSAKGSRAGRESEGFVVPSMPVATTPAEGRGPALVVRVAGGKCEGMAARPNNPVDKVRELQHALFRAAKRDPGRRFHALFDRIWRGDVLQKAWERVRSNDGAAGIDGVSLTMIEQRGVAVPRGSARRDPVRALPTAAGAARVDPETGRQAATARHTDGQGPGGADGDEVRDRADLRGWLRRVQLRLPPRRSATQALEKLRIEGGRGRYFVVDGDIQSFFDTIDKSVLMDLVRPDLRPPRAEAAPAVAGRGRDGGGQRAHEERGPPRAA
jgi:RNA-directed DNA polymerase